MVEFIKDHLLVLSEGLIAFIWVVVRLTPTEKDNRIFSFIVRLLSVIFPNNRKGGGIHK